MIRAESRDTPLELRVVGRPRLTIARRSVAIPEGCRSLLVYVAVRCAERGERCRLSRADVARDLWPDADAERAAGNLRSALWRLRCAGIPALCEEEGCVALAPGVELDLRRIVALAERVARRGSAGLDPDNDFVPDAIAALDLLPGWYDDWAADARARIRCEVLLALDTLCGEWCRAGRCADAIDLALIAVGADPLRESSQAALLAAHLAEHNLVEARRAFTRYVRMLRGELGVGPSPALAALVGARCDATTAGARLTRIAR